MDPITHGIIGAGIYALSNNPVSLTNPSAVAAILGAMSPDLDIVLRYWGNLPYLKHHRGASHSLIGMAFFSALITGFSALFYKDISLWVFLSAFIGAFSHTFFDCLNSYGAKILWPVINKKISANLLMLYDPVITVCAVVSIFIKDKSIGLRLALVSIVVVYLVIRRLQRNIVSKKIKNQLQHHFKVEKLLVMPGMMAIYKWDFNARNKDFSIVGQYNFLTNNINIIKKFKYKRSKNALRLKNTRLWNFFKEFSPSFHVEWQREGIHERAKLIDLRYYFRNKFMHHATVVFDDQEIKESVFHPYSLKNQIKIAE